MSATLSRRVTPSRRGALAGLAAFCAAPALAAGAASAPRVAALDWTLAAGCLGLGVAPAGLAEKSSYARWVREPALPPGVVELGLRGQPSLEGLALLAPDLILTNGFSAPLEPQLRRIAPTLSLDIYGGAGRPLALAAEAIRALGARLGREAEAEAFLLSADSGFDGLRARLGAAPRPPVLPFTLADDRHVWIYGPGSLFADALERIGLASAWTGSTSPWGSATAGLAGLAGVPGATLALVEPVPAEAQAMLSGPGLWAGLTAGRTVLRLPAVWPFGETGAALRFAALVAAALLAREGSRDAG